MVLGARSPPPPQEEAATGALLGGRGRDGTGTEYEVVSVGAAGDVAGHGGRGGGGRERVHERVLERVEASDSDAAAADLREQPSPPPPPPTATTTTTTARRRRRVGVYGPPEPADEVGRQRAAQPGV